MQYLPTSVRLPALLLLVAALGFGIGPAQAQSLPNTQSPMDPSSLGGPPPQLGPPAAIKKAAPVPDALPGAAARADRVAPSQGAVFSDPNDALYDAINRGDIAAARDAIDRGADLDGHDVLGMTPLDLSVDLGRNDITFLLLSLRNGETRLNRGGRSQTAQAAAGKTAGKAQAKSPTKAPTRVATRAPAKPTAVPSVAQQFAGNGGTPDPAAGFLGFGSSR